MNGIGEDSLARMKRIGTARRNRFFRLAMGTCLRFDALQLQQGKIADRPRPSEFGVIKSRIVASRSRKLRKRHDQKDDVPQSSSDNRAARNSALNPALFEKIGEGKISWNFRAAEQRADAAADSLMKTSPADFQLRSVSRGQTNRYGKRFSLSQKVKCVPGLFQRHEPSDYTVTRALARREARTESTTI